MFSVLVGVVTIVTIKHYDLLTPSKSGLLETKKQLVEKVTRALRGISCPLCGESTFIEVLDLKKTNAAKITCRNHHTSIWELKGSEWTLIAPIRPMMMPRTRIEPVHEEEMPKLVFK